jgi:hypothetical protein
VGIVILIRIRHKEKYDWACIKIWSLN